MKIVNSPPRKDTSPRYRRHSHVHFSLPFPHPGALPHPQSQPWGGLCFRLASNAVNSPELIVGVSVGTFFFGVAAAIIVGVVTGWCKLPRPCSRDKTTHVRNVEKDTIELAPRSPPSDRPRNARNIPSTIVPNPLAVSDAPAPIQNQTASGGVPHPSLVGATGK